MIGMTVITGIIRTTRGTGITRMASMTRMTWMTIYGDFKLG